MATVSHEFITEFIELLRSEYPIWDSKSESYKNKREKNKSWASLAQKYKKLEKNATVESVQRKYKSLRASYRRELRKIKKSEKSAKSADDVYVPSLWYFNNMEFLRDQTTQIEDTNTYESESEEEPRVKQPKFEQSYCMEEPVSFLEQPSKYTPEKDEAIIYSESWAVGFRKIKDERQKLFVKRLIDEAILQGQLGNLSLMSSINLYS